MPCPLQLTFGRAALLALLLLPAKGPRGCAAWLPACRGPTPGCRAPSAATQAAGQAYGQQGYGRQQGYGLYEEQGASAGAVPTSACLQGRLVAGREGGVAAPDEPAAFGPCLLRRRPLRPPLLCFAFSTCRCPSLAPPAGYAGGKADAQGAQGGLGAQQGYAGAQGYSQYGQNYGQFYQQASRIP